MIESFWNSETVLWVQGTTQEKISPFLMATAVFKKLSFFLSGTMAVSCSQNVSYQVWHFQGEKAPAHEGQPRCVRVACPKRLLWAPACPRLCRPCGTASRRSPPIMGLAAHFPSRDALITSHAVPLGQRPAFHLSDPIRLLLGKEGPDQYVLMFKKGAFWY